MKRPLAKCCNGCDKPPCVRPSHLFLGTNADNMADKATKGRAQRQRGTDHGQSKLTEDQVYAIRRLCEDGVMSQRAIAGMFGIGRSCVSRIHTRKKWAHLPSGKPRDAVPPPCETCGGVKYAWTAERGDYCPACTSKRDTGTPPGARVPPEKGDVYSKRMTFEWTFTGEVAADGRYVSRSNLGTEVHWTPEDFAGLTFVRRGTPGVGEP